MEKIQMVDLHGQYKAIKNEIDKSIQKVLDHARFIKGGEVKTFEADLATYMDSKHVIGCANGTDALQIALMALDLKPGDEIITSPFTFVATAEVIALLHLKPVFVDIDPATFNIDAQKVAAAITNKTKAILPVHLFGQCAGMKSLLQVAEKHNIHIIEDNAQAIGADYTNGNNVKKAGTMGIIGTTSFFPSKNLGCYGDGGALFTYNDEIAERISAIANHGSKVKYYNDLIGVNSRLDTLQAAILNVKLQFLDQYIVARQQAAAWYDKELGRQDGLIIPPRNEDSTHVFHQYTLRVKNNRRDELKNYLAEHDIPSMVYYPVPLHKQKPYAIYLDGDTNLKHAEQACNEVLSLPMHTQLSERQLTHITNSIHKFFDQ